VLTSSKNRWRGVGVGRAVAMKQRQWVKLIAAAFGAWRSYNGGGDRCMDEWSGCPPYIGPGQWETSSLVGTETAVSGASMEVGYGERKRERQRRFMERKGGSCGLALLGVGEQCKSRVGALHGGSGRKPDGFDFLRRMMTSAMALMGHGARWASVRPSCKWC
jgi:hypothetical protein